MPGHKNTMLITGGGTGIGRGLAEACHKEGHQIIIAGRRRSKLDETVAANPGMRAFHLDVDNPASIQSAVADITKEFPDLNVLVNNAGIMKVEDIKQGLGFLPTAEEEIATNILGPIRLTAALMPTLLAQPRAVVVTVSGGVAFVPMAEYPTYSATKAFIHSWSESIRFQLRDTNVTVTELEPPYVQSELFWKEGATDPRAMKMEDFIAAVMPLLSHPPESGEVIIEQVEPLRYAERDEKYPELFKQVNSMTF
jgi:uncharacterized oxidoreductase